MATSWREKSSGNERTEWHRCKAFNQLADIIEQYVFKGDKVFIEGRLEYWRTEEGKNGVDIIVREMILCERASDRQQVPARGQAPAERQPGRRGERAPQPERRGGSRSPFDEDYHGH